MPSRTRTYVRAATAALLACLAGCADSGGSCTVQSAGTIAIPAGDACLTGVEARVRRGGAWAAADVEVGLERRGATTIVRLTSTAGAEAFALSVPAVDADRMLQQGYQSWGFSGATLIPGAVPLDDDGEPHFGAPRSGDVFDERIGVSYGSAVFGTEAAKVYLTIGAVSSLHASTGIAAVRSEAPAKAAVTVVYGVAREPLPSEGGVARSEPIAFIGSDDPTSGLRTLRDLIADALPPGSVTQRRQPGGWFSWNERFAAIDEGYVRQHIALVRDRLAPRGLDLLEIDDGWEVAWGSWRPNERFAGGMGALAAEISAAGLVPGVWLAPFLVDTDSDAGRTIDPSLVVRDASGAPLVHTYVGATRKYFVLDGSNPRSMALVTDAVAQLAAAGFRFFKLDFLYAGALPGVREHAVTGVEALRMGLELLRRAMGPDSMMNACGAPIYPVLGLAESLRIGPDTAFAGAPLRAPLVAAAARSYAARSHLFPLVWPDADQTQVRDPYDAALARTSAAVAALAGPAFSLGDDLTVLPGDRLALALAEPVLDVAASPEPAMPIGLLDTPAEEITASPFLEIFTTPDGTNAPPPREFAAVGSSGRHYRLRFRWEAPQDVTIEPE